MASVPLVCVILSDMLPPVDPAGAKPRWDHRFLACVSRHEVPKTAGNDDAFKVYDPARVSHLLVRQSVRHPGGVVRSLVMADPRVIGATPLDPWLKSGHPCRGASVPALHNQLIDFCTTQMRHPRRSATGGALLATTIPLPMGDGFRQGSPLDSHRSSRDSGDDLWTDQHPDLDSLRVAPDAHSSVCDPQGGCPMRIWAMLWPAGQTGRVGCPPPYRYKSLF